MNDFMRTALYDAVHNIIPISKNNKKIKDQLNLLALYVRPLANLSNIINIKISINQITLL